MGGRSRNGPGVSCFPLQDALHPTPRARRAGERFPAHPRVQLTCAGHSSEDPALAVLDILAAVVLPAPQDVHTSDPEHGADAIPVVVVPTSHQHTLVIIAVDLQPARHQVDQVREEGVGSARVSMSSAGSERQGRAFQDEGAAGTKVPSCD